jgi:transcriptional regulator with XRE-family HTH domain
MFPMEASEFRAWRQRLGWTQAKVADKLCVSVRAIKHYEGGTRRISPSMEKLCFQLGRRGGFWKGAGGGYVARYDIKTPPRACRWLYETIVERYPSIRLVFDPCTGDGRLLRPWRDAGCTIDWAEITRGRDFFAMTELPFKPDLVVCNPPFNGTSYKRWRLGPEAFLHKILELTDDHQRVVLFTPVGLRANVAKSAERMRHLPNWRITSVVTIPRDFFGKAELFAEILFFNMPRLRPHYVLA